MPEIRLEHVSKIFGKKVIAVNDVSLTIEDGEYISLIGPSGCGKTTTLRLIAGTIFPTHGQIYFDGKDIKEVPIQERNIGFVFQHFAIFPHMTVWENVAYSPTVRGKKWSEIEELVEKSLKAVDLVKKAESFPSELSAPELQQTALARVLASKAKILLLDEPLGALDQKVREEFQIFLRDLVKREHLTAIHVTHDQSEALGISDRVAVMNRGKLIQVGTPDELLFEPQHIFTSFFVGESDFIEGIIIENKDKFAKIKVGKTIIEAFNPHLAKGSRVVIAQRREFYEITKEQATAKNYLPGIVIEDKFLGILRRVRIKLENEQIIEAKIHAKHPTRFHQGEKVKVIIRPERTRCFAYPKEGIQEAIRM